MISEEYVRQEINKELTEEVHGMSYERREEYLKNITDNFYLADQHKSWEENQEEWNKYVEHAQF